MNAVIEEDGSLRIEPFLWDEMEPLSLANIAQFDKAKCRLQNRSTMETQTSIEEEKAKNKIRDAEDVVDLCTERGLGGYCQGDNSSQTSMANQHNSHSNTPLKVSPFFDFHPSVRRQFMDIKRKMATATVLPSGMDLVQIEDEYGRTLLHYAVLSGNESMVLSLLKRGIDVNHRDLAYHYRKKGPPKWAGLTDMAESVVGQRRHSVQSFSIASKGRFPSLPSVKPTPVLLVGRLLVVIGRNSVGHSEKSHGWQERNYGALHLCAKEGNTKLLQLLLQYGADVDLPAWGNQTALHEACFANKADCVEILLQAGAKIEHRTILQYTPLHYAAAGGGLEAIETLLLFGADTTAVGKVGQGFSDCARDMKTWLFIKELHASSFRGERARTKDVV